MTKTPEEIEEDKIFDQEYKKLQADETIEDIFDFLAYSSICRDGHGPKEGEGMDDLEIVTYFADENTDKKPFFINAIPQGYKLLAMTPFPWKGIGMRASLLWPGGYNETQVRQWLEDQFKLLETEAKKRGWYT